jgi:hypothetical protein
MEIMKEECLKIECELKKVEIAKPRLQADHDAPRTSTRKRIT